MGSQAHNLWPLGRDGIIFFPQYKACSSEPWVQGQGGRSGPVSDAKGADRGWCSGSLQDILLGGGRGTCPFHLQPIKAQVGAFLPKGCPYLISGLQSTPPSLRSPNSFLSHEAPLAPRSRPSLAMAQVGAFDPDVRARASKPAYLGPLLGTPSKLSPVPAFRAVGGRRSPAATSPHGVQPMGGSALASPARQRPGDSPSPIPPGRCLPAGEDGGTGGLGLCRDTWTQEREGGPPMGRATPGPLTRQVGPRLRLGEAAAGPAG